MKRSISSKMSRNEVIASMANKLADGTGTGVKPKSRKKILIVNLAVIIIFGSLVFSVSFSKKPPEPVKKISYIEAAKVLHSPLVKLKTAFREGTIGADEYGLYMTYLLVSYDSVPENYRTTKPMIDGNEINAELEKIWGELSMRMRQKITRELPQFRVKR